MLGETIVYKNGYIMDTDRLPVVTAPSIAPGPYDASNADKRFKSDLDEALRKLRKIIKKPGED